ncbi:hypothetical protein MIMGU_mgv1a017561mg [Erythranthe guttata]|uniref:Uncharacterized protein n=1 Tax=Erythranthe guttata TaxID=4155 RepID=A0A022RH08_ERYGU|nr:PREDICTED: uncharacterized protein LOC105955390 [Erythranthe guttata]EYU39451.1 hypothetical protein MIMGU_mgv1a017561mg [Erythranthe guttata]|eukprot:XP_012834561.1 PREDICTED: uncharacterized protein LOC105955390 [Erythranthe guttata]
MGREKNPGLKILWIWTFGTAAVLVANVARTRMRDMNHLINADQDQTPVNNASDDDSAHDLIAQDKS